jgi:RNA polymerase sigma-70 factor (ECF subfamily)
MEGRMPSISAVSVTADLSDGELMALARHGDPSAYEQIVRLYQDRLYNALLHLVADPEQAGELTQETFTRGLNRIGEFQDGAQPYLWFFAIAMKLALGGLRRSRRRPPLHEGMEGALARLDPDYRAVLVMRDIEGFDYQRMSEVLALPPATVKSRLFRARLALRDELKE